MRTLLQRSNDYKKLNERKLDNNNKSLSLANMKRYDIPLYMRVRMQNTGRITIPIKYNSLHAKPLNDICEYNISMYYIKNFKGDIFTTDRYNYD